MVGKHITHNFRIKIQIYKYTKTFEMKNLSITHWEKKRREKKRKKKKQKTLLNILKYALN